MRRGCAMMPGARGGGRRGFTLLEVMFAIGLFFMVAFAVLALVSQCLGQARALQVNRSPIGAIASDAMLVQPLEEGMYNGDFGDLFPDHRWDADVYYSLLATNETLFEVDLQVHRSGVSEPDGRIVLLKWQPQARAQEQKGAFWE